MDQAPLNCHVMQKYLICIRKNHSVWTTLTQTKAYFKKTEYLKFKQYMVFCYIFINTLHIKFKNVFS